MCLSLFSDTSYAGEEVDNEQEMENYLICVIALHKLMQIEQSLMKNIVTSAHQPRVFELIVRDSMDTIVQDGEVNKDPRIVFLPTFIEHHIPDSILK